MHLIQPGLTKNNINKIPAIFGIPKIYFFGYIIYRILYTVYTVFFVLLSSQLTKPDEGIKSETW